jgi:predicted PurR-regulated permease PerM
MNIIELFYRSLFIDYKLYTWYSLVLQTLKYTLLERTGEMKDISLKKKLLLITYAGLLFFLVIHFNDIRALPFKIGTILSPFLMGTVLAFVLNQPVVFFTRLYGKVIKGKKSGKISKMLAILTSYIILFGVSIGIILFIVPQLASNISNFLKNLSGYIGPIETWAIEMTDRYNLQSLDLETIFMELKESIKNVANWTLKYLWGLIPQIVVIASNLVNVLYKVIITLVVSVNLLVGKEKLLSQGKKIVYVYLPPKWAVRIEHIVKLSSEIFGKYVVGQVTEACILAVLCYIGMKILGFEYGILISTLIGITALIPIAGAWIGGGIAFVLLALMSPLKAVFFLVYLSVLQQLENNLIYPKVVGSSIGLPGIWVIFAVTVGGGFFGLPGIMLSVPTVSVIYAILRKDVGEKYPKIKKSIEPVIKVEDISEDAENISENAAAVSKNIGVESKNREIISKSIEKINKEK